MFDLLVGADGRSLTDEALDARRRAVGSVLSQILPCPESLRLSPSTTKLGEAKRGCGAVGATLDGVIAKRRDLAYRSGERTGMQKIKNYRSADCVVGGFRYNEGTTVVGSLLLGLTTSAACCMTSAEGLDDQAPGQAGAHQKAETVDRAARLHRQCAGRPEPLVDQAFERMGALSRNSWSSLLRHFSGDRFRHGTRLLRWRPDKAPKQCSLDQVKQKKAKLMALLD